MLDQVLKTILEDSDIKTALLAYIRTHTVDIEPAWKEIFRLQEAEVWYNPRAVAYWNGDMNVCVLRVFPFNSYSIEAFSYKPHEDTPPSRESDVFTDYTQAIEWAQVRLSEMWQAWQEWKEINRELR